MISNCAHDFFPLTRNVVDLRLYACWKVGVFRDRVAIVIQRRKLSRDVSMSGYQHRWQN